MIRDCWKLEATQTTSPRGDHNGPAGSTTAEAIAATKPDLPLPLAIDSAPSPDRDHTPRTNLFSQFQTVIGFPCRSPPLRVNPPSQPIRSTGFMASSALRRPMPPGGMRVGGATRGVYS